jgi:hypothetical protein
MKTWVYVLLFSMADAWHRVSQSLTSRPADTLKQNPHEIIPL